MNVLPLANLKYGLFAGKYMDRENVDLYESLFEFWLRHWSQAFTEISVPFAQDSGEFCRHEEVTALVQDDKILACALLNYFDVSNPVHLRHPYFQAYPPEVLEKIRVLAKGQPVFTFGYLAVEQEYRKNFQFSDLLLGLAVKRMLESSSHLMITYTRNTRKTNELTYRLGAHALLKEHHAKGEPSDFVYFDKSSLGTVLRHPAHPMMQKLWSQKIYNPSAIVKPIGHEEEFHEKRHHEIGL